MSYITGTVTNANPGVTLYNLMAAELTATGFSLVKTVVISTRTHKIWLSAAAGNAVGKDWYLDVAYTTTGTGIIWLGAFEFFDPATDLAYRGPYVSGIQRPADAVYFSPYGATGNALETNWAPKASDGAATGSNSNLDLPSAAFGYWTSITRDRVILLTSTLPTQLLYTGFYLPSAGHIAAASTDIYPLIVAKVGPGGIAGASAAAITRLPRHVSATSISWSVKASGYFNGSAAIGGAIRVPGLPGDFTTVYPRSAVVMPISTNGDQGTTASFQPPALLGTFRDLAGILAEATVIRGDTVTDPSSNTWVLGTSTNGLSILFKAV